MFAGTEGSDPMARAVDAAGRAHPQVVGVLFQTDPVHDLGYIVYPARFTFYGRRASDASWAAGKHRSGDSRGEKRSEGNEEGGMQM